MGGHYWRQGTDFGGIKVTHGVPRFNDLRILVVKQTEIKGHAPEFPFISYLGGNVGFSRNERPVTQKGDFTIPLIGIGLIFYTITTNQCRKATLNFYQ